MPARPSSPCSQRACPKLTIPGTRYCADHQDKDNERRKQYDRMSRPEYHAWYSTGCWRRTRALYLSSHPLCVECIKRGRVTPSAVVDHIEPHKGDLVKFWDVNNLQSMCKRCHDRKTASEDGGFNNPSRGRG